MIVNSVLTEFIRVIFIKTNYIKIYGLTVSVLSKNLL